MKRLFQTITISLIVLSSAYAKTAVNHIISDDMVLQQQMNVPIWGTGDAGSQITVSFIGQKKTTTANEDGSWKVILDPMQASFKPQTMTITTQDAAGSNLDTKEIKGILIGEVWVASGQSNMQLPMSSDHLEGSKEEAAIADNEYFRVFVRTAIPGERRPSAAHWVSMSPSVASNFSATAYYFGKNLQAELNVPLAIVVGSIGGTTIQRWTAAEHFDANDILRKLSEERAARIDEVERYPAEIKKYSKTNKPTEEAQKWMSDIGRVVPIFASGGLYKRYIRPLQPMAIRGVIWYQGEFNNRGNEAYNYREMQTAQINGWRKDWGQGDFPFIIVQMQCLNNRTTALFRESQLVASERCPNSTVVVICDKSAGLHPPDKDTVGERLSIAARGMCYDKSIPYQGPRLKSMTIVDDKAHLTFKYIGDGLKVTGDNLQPFFICGADKEFKLAKASLDGADKVIVWHDEITEPIAVRYAWINIPKGFMTLYNSADLPASPFRTDTFDNIIPLDKLMSLSNTKTAAKPKKKSKHQNNKTQNKKG